MALLRLDCIMSPQYRTGAPCWLDLGTHDLSGSLDFYRELFGWEFNDLGAETNHYHLITADGSTVGGLMDVSGMTCPEGGEIPTRFDVYLHTDDLASTVAKARQRGTVYIDHEQPGDAGSMSVMADPSGACLNAWQPNQLTGFELPLKHGTPVWFECRSTDFDASADFYREVFDWSVVEMDGMPEGTPRYATNGSVTGTLPDGTQCEAVCGLVDAAAMPPQFQESTWSIFFGCSDLDAALETAQRLGAATGEIGQSPFGRFCQVTDPQGAAFMLNEL